MQEKEALARLIGIDLRVFKVRRSVGELVLLARGLKSEDGENTEYDRALVDLVVDAAHLVADDRMAIARLVGIKEVS